MREMLSSAMRTDGKGTVEGYLFKMWDKCYILWGTTNNVPNQIEIDCSTLKFSVDNGKSWHTSQHINESLNR